MIRVERDLKKQVNEAVRATADAIVEDIRSSWSGMSPSSWGSAPAIVTGLLDNSIVVDDQSRSPTGQFAKSSDMEVWYIRADTAGGEPHGYNYAMALEDPDYLNRPFLAPAMERAAGYYTSNIKRFVRL